MNMDKRRGYATSLLSVLMLFVSLLAAGCTSADESPEGASPEKASDIVARLHRPGVMPKMDGVVEFSLRNPSAPAGAHLSYFGGRVNSATQVVQVIWGAGSYESHVTSTATPSMASFFSQLLSQSTYASWLDSEYNTVNPSGTKTNQHINAGSFVNQVTITPSVTSSTISDAQIQSEITRQINLGILPAPVKDAQGNTVTYYAVFFPHGKTITQGGSNSCQAGGFCAYHGTVAASGSIPEYYYGVHPDMQPGSGCDTGCGNATTAFGNYTSVASHELTEMITDAEVGIATVVGPPLAWYDNTNGEIGDICNAQQSSFAACDGTSYTVQTEFSNAQSNCLVLWAKSCSTANDFSVAVSPTSLSIAQGSSGSTTVTTATTSGSAQTVSFSVSGAPSGMTATFSPTSVTSGGSATLNISTTSAVAAGTYPLTITGSAASGSHTAALSVTVTASVANDFSIAVNPASLSIVQGSAGSSTISTATTSGSAQTVSLSVSGAPSGMTATINPSSVSSGGSATVSISTTTAVAAGTYALTITGTAASGSHTAALSVTVTVPTANDFSIAASPASVSIAQGAAGSSTINTATTSGSAQAISLSVSGTPAGVTATISPSSVSSGGSATLTLAVSTSAVPGTYTLTVTGTAASGSHTTTVSLTVTSGGGCTVQSNLIVNGGFETGSATPWTLTAGVLNSSASEPAHTGSWDAWLDGYGRSHTDSAYQTITIPSGACAATLSFWLHINTSETTTTVAYDTLKVQVRNSSNAVLSTLATYSNLNKATGYVLKSFDLSAFKGQTIRVYFLGVEDVSLQTSFVLDDIAVNVTQ